MNNSLVIAVIPARLASTRLPSKLLKIIRGKSIIQRVYERCQQSNLIYKTIVVADHPHIFNHAREFGAEVFLSKKLHESGTDRIAEFVNTYENCTHVVNVQGDEPFIDPAAIDQLIINLLESQADISTLANLVHQKDDYTDPNKVKVITNINNEALYFSRAPIPFIREPYEQNLFSWKRHIGIYAYKRLVLLELTNLPLSDLERIEKLEQLRWLDHGYKIQVGLTEYESIGIDTEDDLIKAHEYALVNDL